tara:strand:- start:6557 stop:6964 length:408 start_codon:yes stop_codon:yes gene_type:complete
MIFERRAGSGLKILVVFCSALAILTSLGLVAIFLVAMKSISDWEGVQVFQGLTMLLCPVSVLVFSIVMLLCFHCLTRNGARSKITQLNYWRFMELKRVSKSWNPLLTHLNRRSLSVGSSMRLIRSRAVNNEPNSI